MGYKIEHIDPNDLIPFSKNPRLHPESQMLKLMKSLGEFGFTNPILAIKHEGKNLIIAGHARREAALELGLVDVPVIFLDLPYEKAIAYNIADNKIATLGEWEDELLAGLLKGMDRDLVEAVGFDEKEINELLGQYGEAYDGQTDDDDIPEDVEPMCRAGDLWELGRHRLLCGDATINADVEKLLGEKITIDLVVTSPPYYNQRDYSYFKSISEYEKFVLHTIQAFIPCLSSHAVVAWNCGNGEADNYDISAANSMMLGQASLTFTDKIVWKKSGAVFDIPRSQHIENYRYFPAFAWEPIYIYKHGSLQQFDPQHKKEAREHQTNVWEMRQVKTNKEQDNEGHPAQFPLELPMRLIKFYSHQNRPNIYDCYGGSGTTLIAAEKLGRVCYMMEIDSHYCDVILQRFINFTGTESEVFLLEGDKRTGYAAVVAGRGVDG